MKWETIEEGNNNGNKISPQSDVSIVLNVEPFDISKPLEWNDYVEFVELNFAANHIDTLSDAQQVVKFLATAGRGIFDLVRNLVAPASFRDFSFAEIKAILAKHFLPSDSVLLSTHTFYWRKRRKDESYLEYATALKNLATGCDFGTYEDRALRDHFICGLSDSEVRDRVLRSETNLSFKEVVAIALSADKTATIDAIDHDMLQLELKNGSAATAAAATTSLAPAPTVTAEMETETAAPTKVADTAMKPCRGCDGNHERSKCPFRASICEFCKTRGHVIDSCMMRKKTLKVISKIKGKGNVKTRYRAPLRVRKLAKLMSLNKSKLKASKTSKASSNDVKPQKAASCAPEK